MTVTKGDNKWRKKSTTESQEEQKLTVKGWNILFAVLFSMPMSIKVWVHVSVILNQCNASRWRRIKIRSYICLSTGFIGHDYNLITDYSLQSLTLAMSNSNGWSISADFGATSVLLTIKHSVKQYFSLNKMGRKKLIKGGALKNNTDKPHGISLISHGENPTEFFFKVCLVPV